MIRTDNSHFPTYAESHPGMSGKNNEDRFAVSAFRMSENDSTPALLAVLCDGIGGHRAGEVAAEMAVNTISEKVAESDGTQPIQTLNDAVKNASCQIHLASQEDPERQGMGATCACAWVIGSRLYSASVGDSRIYLMRGNRIQQMSIDHTWIQEALEAGIIQPAEAEGHPNAHVIRRYLGGEQPPLVDHRLRVSGHETDGDAEANQGMQLHPGDRLLICSDGLSDLVDDTEVLEAFRTGESAQAAIHSLIELANLRGGHDNITIILIDVPLSVRKPEVPGKGRISRLILWVLAVVLGAGFLAALVWGSLWFLNRARGNQENTISPEPNSSAIATAVPQQDSTDMDNPVEGIVPTIPGATTEPILPSMMENGATITPWPTNTPMIQVSPSGAPSG